ncbi:hypothetical protein D9M72_465860 [compost metagenome]
MEWLPWADGPVALIIGISPTTKASEVMIIGRRRSLAASMDALPSAWPDLRFCTANSTIRMAFLASSPISMTSATCT